MKKTLLLSTFVFAAAVMNAQTLTVSVDGKQIENGATVTSYEYEAHGTNDDYSFQLCPLVLATSSIDDMLRVTVQNTTTDINEEFTAEYEANFFGDDPYRVQFCWPELCTPPFGPGQSQMAMGRVGANAFQNLMIESISISTQPYDGFTVTCYVTITPANSDNAFSFTLNMVYDGAGVDGVSADEATPVYYNLNGVKVSNPDHGIFIKKQGAKVTKVIL